MGDRNLVFFLGKVSVGGRNLVFLLGKVSVGSRNLVFLLGKVSVTHRNLVFFLGKVSVGSRSPVFPLGKVCKDYKDLFPPLRSGFGGKVKKNFQHKKSVCFLFYDFFRGRPPFLPHSLLIFDRKSGSLQGLPFVLFL